MRRNGNREVFAAPGILATLAVTVALGVAMQAGHAFAQPSADQVLADMGISESDKKKALGGEFVANDLAPVSERDLSVSIVFLVKASPDALVKEILSGNLLRNDPQVKGYGDIAGAGAAADFAGVTIDTDVAARFAGAKPGRAINLSTAEIAAFASIQGGAPPAVKRQLQQMLLARYQAYQSSGLAGIAPYERGNSKSDPADDLRKAGESYVGLKKYLPSFHKALLGYPKATSADTARSSTAQSNTVQLSRWLKYDIDGVLTYVLEHNMIASDGAARAVAQRQYYVSSGYNAEQAVAAFLPVTAGTLVVYMNHTFTDQVAGWGGSGKRSIGRRMMESKLKAMFDREREDFGN